MHVVEITQDEKEARERMNTEIQNFYCAAPWSFLVAKRTALILCKDSEGREYRHGLYRIVKH